MFVATYATELLENIQIVAPFHKSTVILIELRWTFSMPENRLESGFWAISAYCEPFCGAIPQKGLGRFRGSTVFYAVVIVKQPSNR